MHLTCNADCHVTYCNAMIPESRALRLIAQVPIQSRIPRWTWASETVHHYNPKCSRPGLWAPHANKAPDL